MTPAELQAQAQAALEGALAEMTAALEPVRRMREGGELMSKAETRAFNRACTALRYASDCAKRCKARGPKGKSNRRPAWWVESQRPGASEFVSGSRAREAPP